MMRVARKPSGYHAGLRRRRAWVQIAVAALSVTVLGKLFTPLCLFHQAAKLVAALLRVAGVTAGMAESNASLLLSL